MVGYSIVRGSVSDCFECFLLHLQFFILIDTIMLVPGKCTRDAQIYAATCLEMHVKAPGDHWSSTSRALVNFQEQPKNIRDPVSKADRVLDTF
jgi:hypothetical protein